MTNSGEGKKKALTSVKSLIFSGKESYWKEWSTKVKAYGRTKGWEEALLKEDAKQESKDEALNFLIMSLTGNAFIFVSHATDPYLVWNELCTEFEPKEDMDLYDLKESFSNCKLKHDGENVSMWLKRLENINRMLHDIDRSHMISEGDFKVHIKANLPKKLYKVFLTTNRKNFSTMTYDELKNDLKSFWRQSVRRQSIESDEEEDVLVMDLSKNKKKKGQVHFVKPFKGTCFNCGKIGHKSRDCPDKKNKKKFDKSKIKCFKCGEYGHYASECKTEKTETNWFVGTTHQEENQDFFDSDYGEEWVEVGDDGVNLEDAVVEVGNDEDDLEVLGTANRYEVLSCDVEGWEPELENRLTIDLTPSEEESVDKLFSSDSEDEDFEIVDRLEDDVVEAEAVVVEKTDGDDESGEKVSKIEKCNFVRNDFHANCNKYKKKRSRKRTKKAWKRRRPQRKQRILYAEKKRMLRQSFDALQEKMNRLAKALELKVNKCIKRYTLDVDDALRTYLSFSLIDNRTKLKNERAFDGCREVSHKSCNFHRVFSAIERENIKRSN